ncbi:hypothetical protein QBC43DRAFT_303099 [Cladorrhinum sp. PSN259]|nr:hypothetical protein QBC43DRAFT_303099 [Cladorrhinum sp. PSN259]
MSHHSLSRGFAKLPTEIKLMIWEYVAESSTPRIHLVPFLCPRRQNHRYRKAIKRWATWIQARHPSPSIPDLRQTCRIAHNVLGEKWGVMSRHNLCAKSRIAIFQKMHNLAIDLEWDLVYHNENWMSMEGNNSIFSQSYLSAANIAVKYIPRRPSDSCKFHHESDRTAGERDICYRCVSDFATRFKNLKRFYVVVEAQLAYISMVEDQQGSDGRVVALTGRGPPFWETSGGKEFAVITAPSTVQDMPEYFEITHESVMGAFRDLERLSKHYVARKDSIPCARRVQFMILLTNAPER